MLHHHQSLLRYHLHSRPNSHPHSRLRSLHPVIALTLSSTIAEPTRTQATAIGSRVSARHVRRHVDSVAQALRHHQSLLRYHLRSRPHSHPHSRLRSLQPVIALTPSATIVEPTRTQATAIGSRVSARHARRHAACVHDVHVFVALTNLEG